MTVLGSLRTWMRESKVGDEYIVGEHDVTNMSPAEVEQFNAELPTINPKFVHYKLTNDARGYIFTRVDDGDKLFNGDADARLETNIPVSRFRPRYRKLSDTELFLMDEIKTKAAEMEALYERIPDADRYSALAITRLEESVMWAVKDLTK